MKRVLCVCVAACGAPHVDPAQPVPVAVTADAGIDAVKIVDTSIATVWNTAALEPRVEAPVAATAVEPVQEWEPVATPMPRARMAGRRAPCFSNRNVLVGREVWTDVQRFAITMNQEHPPSGRYGTCKINEGEIRDREKRLVAAVGCGLTIYLPGITDDHGFEIGASGADVAAARPDDSIRCAKALDARTICVFNRPSDENAATYYVFDGQPAIADDAALLDADARVFIRDHKVVEMTLRITCH